MYINRATILGNLTRDPELKSLPNGTKVVSLALATNRSWKDANGQKQEAVDYHNVAAFGKPAELIAQYCKKGNSLYVEGRLTTRSWDDQATGKKAYRTEVILENFQFGPKGTSAPSATAGDTKSEPDTNVPKFEDNLGTIDYGDSINPDDIPF